MAGRETEQLVGALSDPVWGRPVAPTAGPLRPLGMAEVRLDGGFWGTRQQRNAEHVIGHCLSWIRRVGWIDNFAAAVDGRLPLHRRGREFSDSDVYKFAEAMAWEVGRSGDEALDKELVDLAGLLAAAQEPDGYLNTRFGRPGQGARYSDLEWGHELYCYGHLIQAGVARLRTTGEDLFTEVVLRAADHVCAEFGRSGRQGVCGHPVVEMALVELYRTTGQRRYLEQARLFVDRRGRPALADIEFGRGYFQDDTPVRAAKAFRGHAVRAMYLACGAVDVAVETGDDALLTAVVRQWEHTVARRVYLTGGIGSRHQDEAFGEDFELPPDRAYAETCAAIGSVMLSWRLLLATGEARFADLAERTLFNAVAVSPAEDASSFFYRNTLHQRSPSQPPPPDRDSPRAAAGMRAPWYEVSCCPTNIARTFAGLACYVATTDSAGVRIHQFAAGTVRTTVGGEPVELRIRTDYPYDGRVTVRVERAPDVPVTLQVRVPAWESGAEVRVGRYRERVGPGYAAVRRQWSAGEELVLDLPMTPHWTRPDPRIDAVRGCVAAERGPLVYCLESLDQAVTLDAISVDTGEPPVPVASPDDLPAAPTLSSAALSATARPASGSDKPWPYGPLASADELPADEQPVTAVFVPYHLWGNRGPSTMRVFVPEHPRQGVTHPAGPADGPSAAAPN